MKNDHMHRHGKRMIYTVLSFAGILFLLGVWFLASYLIQLNNPARGAIILPSLIDALESFPTFSTFDLSAFGAVTPAIAAKVILKNTAISLARLLSGLVIGIVLGVLIGLILSAYDTINKLIGPIIMFLRTIPILALVPLFLSWFGGKEVGNIIYISFAVFCMIVVNTVEAAKNVPIVYHHYAATLGASKARILRTIVLPHIIPELVGGISVVVGMAWAILLAAEYLAAQAGIGYMLIASERYMFTAKMVFILLLLMFLAVIFNALVQKAGNRITSWKPRVDSKKFF